MYRLSGAQLQKVQAARNKGVQLPPVRSYEFHRVNRADGSIRLCGVSRDSALKQRNRNVSAEPRNTIKSSRNDATPSVKPRGRGGGHFQGQRQTEEERHGRFQAGGRGYTPLRKNSRPLSTISLKCYPDSTVPQVRHASFQA